MWNFIKQESCSKKGIEKLFLKKSMVYIKLRKKMNRSLINLPDAIKAARIKNVFIALKNEDGCV